MNTISRFLPYISFLFLSQLFKMSFYEEELKADNMANNYVKYFNKIRQYMDLEIIVSSFAIN